jgi:multiple sugar transport system ATP-binding protein
MAYLVLDNLSKRFGPVTAVDRATLDINEGEFFALLGPSGCGKTTTMRLIAGLERATEGTIRIGGRDVTQLPPRDRNVAMVFQDYALYPHMTVLDNIGYPLKVRGVSRREIVERVESVGKSLQLGGLLGRRPAQLSGGQQQRAAVGRAVVHHAGVFLFDEPLSNLDAKLRHEARAFLKKLQRDIGVTTVFVTHDQAEAMALADRIGIMNEGRIVQVGTPVEVYRRPETTFVAGFIGSPPMNLLQGTLELDDGSARLNIKGNRLDITPALERLRSAFKDGEEIVLGVRPEHLRLGDGENGLRAEVYAVQPLGPEVLITLALGGELISVLLFTDEPPELDGEVRLSFDPKRIHLYRSSGELAVAP